MKRTRLIAVALLGLASVLGFACKTLQQNGAECLKSDDCENGKCVQFVCYDPAQSKIGAPDTGAPVAADTGSDSGATADAAPEAAAETATPETGDNDTGAADTASSD